MKTASERWQITIPIYGISLDIKTELRVQDVIFRALESIDGNRIVMGSVEVSGTKAESIITGSILIDRATLRLSWAYGHQTTISSDDVYLTILEPLSNREKKGWGWHDCVRKVSAAINIGDWQKLISTRFLNIDSMKEDKKIVLDKALGYYREALTMRNPFHKIVTYFSCINVIVRDVKSLQDVKTSDIQDVLEEFVKLDRKTCRKYYGEYRSAADHGHIDTIDHKNVLNAVNIERELWKITSRLIEQFIERNRKLTA